MDSLTCVELSNGSPSRIVLVCKKNNLLQEERHVYHNTIRAKVHKVVLENSRNIQRPFLTFATSAAMNFSYTASCTNTLAPIIHVCPLATKVAKATPLTALHQKHKLLNKTMNPMTILKKVSASYKARMLCNNKLLRETSTLNHSPVRCRHH